MLQGVFSVLYLFVSAWLWRDDIVACLDIHCLTIWIYKHDLLIIKGTLFIGNIEKYFLLDIWVLVSHDVRVVDWSTCSVDYIHWWWLFLNVLFVIVYICLMKVSGPKRHCFS